MDEIQISLSWDGYQKNICSGLSLLQQRGEFVDMTLAADGKHIKVHQMVMSLVSPYIKELISTAQCPHPIIFLYNMSYTTLCSILEYIYSGELLVTKDNLDDIIAAGKALRIKGLEEMTEETNNPQTEETNDSIPKLDKSTTKISPTDVILQEYEESKKLHEKFKNVSQYLQPNTVPIIDEEDADQTVDTITNTNSQEEDKSNALGVLKTIVNNFVLVVVQFLKRCQVHDQNIEVLKCYWHVGSTIGPYLESYRRIAEVLRENMHTIIHSTIRESYINIIWASCLLRTVGPSIALNLTEQKVKRRPPKESKDSDSE